MIEKLGGMTGDIVRMALDASWLRHKVISNNIANAKTEGFIPHRVEFESQFTEALKVSNRVIADPVLQNELAKIKPEVIEVEKNMGTDEKKVYLDREMVNLARNTTHYKALIEGRSKGSSIITLAIRGGK